MTGLIITLIVFAVLLAVAVFNLPAVLSAMGLHRHYPIPDFDLSGKCALVICTNHSTLDPAPRLMAI